MPEKFVAVASADDIRPGQTKRIVVDGHAVVTGEPMEEPATEALKTWPVRLQDWEILVGIGMP